MNERLSNRSVHGDGLSSTQLVTDDTGAQAARIVYGAWGEQLSVNDSVPGGLDVRFVGGLGVRNDSASGLIYMRHRWYDAQLGRFISRDPIGHAEYFLFQGISQKRPEAVISRIANDPNLHVYCESNPLVYVDPYGLLSAADCDSWKKRCQDVAKILKAMSDKRLKEKWAKAMIETIMGLEGQAQKTMAEWAIESGLSVVNYQIDMDACDVLYLACMVATACGEI